MNSAAITTRTKYCSRGTAASAATQSVAHRTRRGPLRTDYNRCGNGEDMNILQEFEKAQMSRKLPDFGPGDTVVVNVKVKVGNRERVQAYEGVVIAVRSRGLNSAFTVRKISHGTGVERVFQTYSPAIDSVTVKRRGKVARAK